MSTASCLEQAAIGSFLINDTKRIRFMVETSENNDKLVCARRLVLDSHDEPTRGGVCVFLCAIGFCILQAEGVF